MRGANELIFSLMDRPYLDERTAKLTKYYHNTALPSFYISMAGAGIAIGSSVIYAISNIYDYADIINSISLVGAGLGLGVQAVFGLMALLVYDKKIIESYNTLIKKRASYQQ